MFKKNLAGSSLFLLILSALILFSCMAVNEHTLQAAGEKAVPYLSKIENEVVAELNRVRADPAGYAEKYVRFSGEKTILTAKGINAAEECYKTLKRAKSLPLLSAKLGLSKAADFLAADQAKTGKIGHYASDGSNPFDRMDRFGSWKTTAGENIDYGNTSARRIVLALLIDDGVPERGHRKNILNPKFKTIGVAFGPHSGYGFMCVMDLAGGYIDK